MPNFPGISLGNLIGNNTPQTYSVDRSLGSPPDTQRSSDTISRSELEEVLRDLTALEQSHENLKEEFARFQADVRMAMAQVGRGQRPVSYWEEG